MSLEKIANSAVRKLVKSFPGYDFTDEQRDEVARVIASAMRDTVSEAARVHREATVLCCGPEADLAHKIAHEADQQAALLVASLMHQR